MRDTFRSSRVRTAAAALTAAALLAISACGAGDDDSPGTKNATAPQRPSPKPTPLWDTTPASIAALGDSITRGFDACGVLADCPEVSWATGSDKDVPSLAKLLLKGPATQRNSWNYARTGARMADLPGQVEQAVEKKPELVTVLLGSNDACRDQVSDMTSVDRFRTEFEASMKSLRSELPKTQVYVASVPDLKRLWSQGRENPLGKQVWKLGICASMLSDPDAMDQASTARRDEVQARVVAYNTVLKEVCAKDKRCRYDGGAVFDYRFTGDQLSKWDWFHPSRNGQGRLAEIAYGKITKKG